MPLGGAKLRLNERNNPTTDNRVQISRARARVARRLLPRGNCRSVGRSLARSYKLVTTNLDAAHSRTQSPEEEQRTIIKFTALTPNTSAVPFSSAIWNPSDVGLFKEDRTSLVFKSYCYNWALLVQWFLRGQRYFEVPRSFLRTLIPLRHKSTHRGLDRRRRIP